MLSGKLGVRSLACALAVALMAPALAGCLSERETNDEAGLRDATSSPSSPSGPVATTFKVPSETPPPASGTPVVSPTAPATPPPTNEEPPPPDPTPTSAPPTTEDPPADPPPDEDPPLDEQGACAPAEKSTDLCRVARSDARVTGRATYPVQVPGGVHWICLDFHVEPQEGTLKVSVLKPDGSAAAMTLGGHPRGTSVEFPGAEAEGERMMETIGATGEWTLLLEFSNWSGDAEIVVDIP